MSYELGDALPAPLPDAVDPGTNILVSGPSMSGKRELILEVLGHGATQGDGSVVVTGNDGGKQIYDSFQGHTDATDPFVRIVDSVSAEVGDGLEDVLHPVSSPGDLTGIGIEFSQIAKEASGRGIDGIRVGFDSISALLMYVELERLFRFLHVFTQQIQSKGWVGLFAIDPDSHDRQVINTVNQLFDGVLELRLPEAGGREIRSRGFRQSPTAWTTFE